MVELSDEDLIIRISRAIEHERLIALGQNIAANGRDTPAVKAAIRRQYGLIARDLVARKTGLNFAKLSPAEERIVLAVSEYVGLQKVEGKSAEYTFRQIRNRGLRGAAEEAVARAKPTQGFTVLQEADRRDLSYEQIILDYPEEFTERARWFARRALGLENENETAAAPARKDDLTQERTNRLILWLRTRRDPTTGRIAFYTNADAAAAMGIEDMSRYGQPHGNIQSRVDFACYLAGLPPLGMTADAPFSRAWRWGEPGWEFPLTAMRAAAQDRAWTEQDFNHIEERVRTLPAGASPLWKNEVSNNPEAIKAWAVGLGQQNASRFWVFVCNPRRWAVDEFLERGIEIDTWSVRPSDTDNFAPGQLALLRISVDQRTLAERHGRPVLTAGIYAVCQVLSSTYPSSSPSDGFWSSGERREAGWPTVDVRYLKTYRDRPLTIEHIRNALPQVSQHLRDGLQAVTFPISSSDFSSVMALLDPGTALPSTGETTGLSYAVREIENREANAAPEVKERISRYIERGPAGAKAKRLNGYKCQLCEAMGLPPYSFKKPSGEHYIEAHHVMPVSKLVAGSLDLANIMTLCANHHRQMHYGEVEVDISDEVFLVAFGDLLVEVPRARL